MSDLLQKLQSATQREKSNPDERVEWHANRVRDLLKEFGYEFAHASKEAEAA